MPAGVRPLAPGGAARRAVVIRATAAPAKAAPTQTSEVDTSLTPKQLGFTMPGVFAQCSTPPGWLNTCMCS